MTLKVGAGTVDVHRPDGSLLQSLPYEGEEPDDNRREFFAFVRDMDFDGDPDVGVLFSQGMQNIYYDAWLWREDAGCFVKYERMRGVSSPEFDAERERIYSYEHVSALQFATAEYSWENGALVLLERKIRGIPPGMALVNNLGFRIASVRTYGFDGLSEPIATDVADGVTIGLGNATLAELWGGARLLVKNAEDENDSAPQLQFSPDTFPGDADSMALALRDGVPVLQFFEDGHLSDEVPAGLPLETLLSAMENGLEASEYSGLMTPPEADGWESYPFAVRTGKMPWRLLPPGPIFEEGGDGVKRLSAVSFGRGDRRIDLAWDKDGAFDGLSYAGMWHAAKTVEKGFAARYVLNGDGTFVYAASEFGGFERELFKAGTWTVADDELRLEVKERWVVPVGGVENIGPGNTVTVVDGDVVKRVCRPPETETHGIARAEMDRETGRGAVTIDGTTFYAFDGQADFLKRYDELRKKQGFDFSSLEGVTFTFASGAGAWSTEVEIQPDGTFSGWHSDSDMGESGPGYPDGTHYFCKFGGTFAPPEKADGTGYAYTLKCVELSWEDMPGGEEIRDGMRHVPSEPYGFENALGEHAYTLFLPGTPFDKLPEYFLRAGYMREDGEPRALDAYYLCFPPDDVVFRGSKE